MLEYCSSVWNPGYQCDIELIESVQRRFTKHIAGLKSLTYPERLKILHTESLERRRLISDLPTIYRIIHGYSALDSTSFITLGNSNTRGHQLKLKKQYSRVNSRAFSFANRCTDAWNSLSNADVYSSSVCVFNSRLKQSDFSEFLYFV